MHGLTCKYESNVEHIEREKEKGHIGDFLTKLYIFCTGAWTLCWERFSTVHQHKTGRPSIESFCIYSRNDISIPIVCLKSRNLKVFLWLYISRTHCKKDLNSSYHVFARSLSSKQMIFGFSAFEVVWRGCFDEKLDFWLKICWKSKFRFKKEQVAPIGAISRTL